MEARGAHTAVDPAALVRAAVEAAVSGKAPRRTIAAVAAASIAAALGRRGSAVAGAGVDLKVFEPELLLQQPPAAAAADGCAPANVAKRAARAARRQRKREVRRRAKEEKECAKEQLVAVDVEMVAPAAPTAASAEVEVVVALLAAAPARAAQGVLSSDAAARTRGFLQRGSPGPDLLKKVGKRQEEGGGPLAEGGQAPRRRKEPEKFDEKDFQRRFLAELRSSSSTGHAKV